MFKIAQMINPTWTIFQINLTFFETIQKHFSTKLIERYEKEYVEGFEKVYDMTEKFFSMIQLYVIC